MHDRNYYRSLSARRLLTLASEEGINSEMAIAITNKLADIVGETHLVGSFRFNHEEHTK